MHEVLVNRLGGLSLPRKSVVRLTDCPDMTLDVYRGHKTTMQQKQIKSCTKQRAQPFLTSRLVHPYDLDESIFSFSRCFHFYYILHRNSCGGFHFHCILHRNSCMQTVKTLIR